MILQDIFLGRNTEALDITAVKIGIITKSAVPEGFLYGHAAVDFLASNGKTLDQYIVPESRAGDFLKSLVHVRLADAELLAQMIQREIFRKMLIDENDDISNGIGNAHAQGDIGILGGLKKTTQGEKGRGKDGQNALTLVGDGFCV